VPYGEPWFGEAVRGAVLTYQNSVARRFDLDMVASYTHRSIDFVDKGKWRYDWRGERIFELRRPGELELQARNQTVWQQGAFGRAVLDVKLARGHDVTATLSPDFITRTGKQRLLPDPMARDPLAAERRAFKLVSGVAYTLHAVPLPSAPKSDDARRPDHHRLENTVFAKSYLYRVHSDQLLSGGVLQKRDQKQSEFGFGDSLRVTLLGDYLLAKASYEYAARLPDVDEIFGNSVLILDNLTLAPERGHNANLGTQLDLRRTKAGSLLLDLNGFYRDIRDQIVLFGRELYYQYENVYRARSVGIENTVRWQSPKRYVTLDGQLTYMDQRNVSGSGTFGRYKGDRIPNRPWFFASWGGALRFERLLTRSDRIEPFYQGRFVDEFFFGWESVGLRDTKPTVPAQTSHTVGLTYSVELGRTSLYATFDVQNLSDAKLYDAFGVQRPGRGYYGKLILEL
jgi:hypothetical protein